MDEWSSVRVCCWHLSLSSWRHLALNILSLEKTPSTALCLTSKLSRTISSVNLNFDCFNSHSMHRHSCRVVSCRSLRRRATSWWRIEKSATNVCVIGTATRRANSGTSATAWEVSTGYSSKREQCTCTYTCVSIFVRINCKMKIFIYRLTKRLDVNQRTFRQALSCFPMGDEGKRKLTVMKRMLNVSCD